MPCIVPFLFTRLVAFFAVITVNAETVHEFYSDIDARRTLARIGEQGRGWLAARWSMRVGLV